MAMIVSVLRGDDEEEEEDAGAGVGYPVSPFTVGWRVGVGVGYPVSPFLVGPRVGANVGAAVDDDDAVHLLPEQTPDEHCESASACVIAVEIPSQLAAVQPLGFVEQYPPAFMRDDPVPLPSQKPLEEQFPLLHRELPETLLDP